MADLNRAFGQRLRVLRESALLTQRELARKAGMDYKYIGAVERGERNITLYNVERIRAAIGVEPWQLFAFRAKGTVTDEMVDNRILGHLLDKCDKSVRNSVLALVKQIVRLSKSRAH